MIAPGRGIARRANRRCAVILVGVPPSRSYVWRNLPLDVAHVLAYLVAHEGHHRGQIVMAARQLGQPLPVSITGGLWQWTKRAQEAT